MEKKISLGFTLVELLIVIGVMGALASAVLVIINPLGQLQKARDAKRKSDLVQIQRSLEQYYQDNGEYPASTIAILYRIIYAGNPVNWGTAKFSPYMSLLPTDPVSGKRYVYYSPPPSYQSYYLYASLDRGSADIQACSGNFCDSLTATNGLDANACGGSVASPCNFGVTSPNATIE